MVMNIEVMESYTDYTATTTGDAPMSSYWLFSGTSNCSIGAMDLDPTERGLAIRSVSNGTSSSHTRMFATGVTKITCHFAFSIISLGDGTINPMVSLLDTAANVQMFVRMTDYGKMCIFGEGGAIFATSEMNLNFDVLYRCCLRVEITGTNLVNCAMSINGFDDPGLTQTGVDLQDASLENFGGVRTRAVTGSPAGNGGDWDLWELMVGTGECVDWGPIEIVDGYPNEDIVSEWTPSTGTDNYATVDEAQVELDDYNATETPDAKDIFGFTDPEVPESIIAIGVVSWHHKEDSATRKFQHILRVEDVDYNGPDVFSSETRQRQLDAWVENPATAAAWEPTDLAGLEWGYQYKAA